MSAYVGEAPSTILTTLLFASRCVSIIAAPLCPLSY
jgi:hypothetical protein